MDPRFIKWAAWAACIVTVTLAPVAVLQTRENGTGTPAEAVVLTMIVGAIVGAIVVSRLPSAATGWLLLAISLDAAVAWNLWEYGYRAIVFRAALPLGSIAFAAGSWMWVPAIGAALPALLARIPDDRVRPGWTWIDPVALLGSAAVTLWVATMPGRLDPRVSLSNPFAISGNDALLSGLRWIGYLAVAAAVAGSLSSLIVRFAHAQGDERQQLKWIGSAAALMTAALLYGLLRQVLGPENLFDALSPFFVSTVALPVGIGFAILKYRLYDIDLVINRTLVYGGLTAMLAGLYTFWVALTQRLVASSGQRSDLVILLTAFAGAAAFTPVKNWLQKTVDRRFAVHDPASVVDSMRQQVEVIVNVLDAQRIARRLVDDSAATYQARCASLTLGHDGEPVPFHTSGDPSASMVLRIVLHSGDREVGVLSLAERRGGAIYTLRDQRALQRCADAVGEAIGLWDGALHSQLQRSAH